MTFFIVYYSLKNSTLLSKIIVIIIIIVVVVSFAEVLSFRQGIPIPPAWDSWIVSDIQNLAVSKYIIYARPM